MQLDVLIFFSSRMKKWYFCMYFEYFHVFACKILNLELYFKFCTLLKSCMLKIIVFIN